MLFYFQFHGQKITLLLQDLGTYLFLVRRSVQPICQSFIHNRMWIFGHILLLRAIVVREILGLFLSPSSFCLHACQEKFVYTKPITCEINLTEHHVFVLLCHSLICNKIHFNRQDTVSMLSKLKYVRQFCFHVSFNLNCHTTHTSLLPSTVCV